MTQILDTIVIRHLEKHDNFKGNGADAFWYQFCSSKPLDKKTLAALAIRFESVINHPSTEWVSVDEPPKSTGYYLVYDINTFGPSKIEVYRFDSYNNSWYWGADCFHPTHWMPLPTAPQEAKQ